MEFNRQWLCDLWLEATLHDSVFWRISNDRSLFFGFASAYVLDLHRLNVRRLVADEARLLTPFGSFGPKTIKENNSQP